FKETQAAVSGGSRKRCRVTRAPAPLARRRRPPRASSDAACEPVLSAHSRPPRRKARVPAGLSTHSSSGPCSSGVTRRKARAARWHVAVLEPELLALVEAGRAREGEEHERGRRGAPPPGFAAAVAAGMAADVVAGQDPGLGAGLGRPVGSQGRLDHVPPRAGL